MSFLEPLLLWGALAVVIPVAIHFWHQRQGRPLPWAATQWLTESEQQQSRGIRLDNVLLLLIRCLLLVLLAVLLAQPILRLFDQPATIQRVHLVQPSARLTDNYRFELAKAAQQGDRIYWATPTPTAFDPATNPTPPTADVQQMPFNVLTLQTAINTFDPTLTDLTLYVLNNASLADVPAITVPQRFHLQSVADSSRRPSAYLTGKGGKRIFVNRAGRLTSTVTPEAGLNFRPSPAHSGPIQALLQYRNPRERQTVRAALTALTDVYALDLTVTETPTTGTVYDWILADRYPLPAVRPSAQALYVVSGPAQSGVPTNVTFTEETLTPQTSDRVAGGQLPEWLGGQLVHHYQLSDNPQPLPQRALDALFISSTRQNTTQQAGTQQALFLAFVVLLVVERGLALFRNA